MTREAWEELQGVVTMDASSAKRLEWLRAWKAKWLEELTSIQTVDTLQFAYAVDRARLEDHLKRQTAFDLGKLIIDHPQLSVLERDRVDVDGFKIGDLSLDAYRTTGRMGALAERFMRRVTVLRRAPR